MGKKVVTWYFKMIFHKFPAGTKVEQSNWDRRYFLVDSNLGYTEYEAKALTTWKAGQ
jgi:hypothetical protein